ncbi:hypothetical protein OESDEN_19363 [Oesophagostomum dentatum]|uniref:Uncharacterized protein n=1 Tax=Oesophagostomum dentatum TaxID=61180 RepID=A0A0B1SAN5_OESDE|nr:hypothetical protein OESDEN_19363 [Oesophagostomum dentatum]
MSLMLCGERCTNAAKQECLKEGDESARFKKAMELVNVAKHLYEKGIEILASYQKYGFYVIVKLYSMQTA